MKDLKGQVISGADLRVEATGGSSWNKVVKTDAKGHYLYNSLEVHIPSQSSQLIWELRLPFPLVTSERLSHES